MSGSVREGLDLRIIESGCEETGILEDGWRMKSFPIVLQLYRL